MRKFWGTRSKVKEIMESSFQSLVKKAMDGEGGTVSIFRYDPENPNGLMAKITPFDSDVKEWKDRDVSAYLNQIHGGGRYRVQINYRQKNGTLVEAKTYDYIIGGEPKEGGYTESKRAKQAETQQVTDIFKTAMDFAKEVKGGDSNAQITQTLISSLMNQITEMRKENTTLILKLIADKEAGGGGMSEIISNMMQMEEFKSMLQPKVETNETLEMIKAAGPIVGALIAGKTGIQPQQQDIQMIETSPPGQDISLGSSEPVRKTPAGNPEQAIPPEIKIPNGTKVKRDEFETVMIDPLVDQIDSGASPEEIANLIQMIVSWSFLRARSGIEPHQSVIGMVMAISKATEGKADLTIIEKAYTDFVTSIEMPVELREPVKQELLKIYMPMLLQAQQNQKGGVVNATSAP